MVWMVMREKKDCFFLSLAPTHVALDANAVDEEVSVKGDASREEGEDGMVAGGITPPSTTPPPQEDKEITCHWTKNIKT